MPRMGRTMPRIIARKATTPQKERVNDPRSPNKGSRTIVLDDSAFESQEVVPAYQEQQLPGVADEVESYPCKFCQHKVFLTPIGLEKHARMEHPDRVNEILHEIATISNEWKKREFERKRICTLVHTNRLRHEVRANQLVRAALNGHSAAEPSANDVYDACEICHLLVNTAHPTAMDSHMRAHKKNDELRGQLLEQFGTEIVARLTCDHCQLVFTEERKLQLHNMTAHAKRRRYICKFCGQISPTLTELNLHKIDVHNVLVSNKRLDDGGLLKKQRMDGEERLKKICESGLNYGKSLPPGTISEGNEPCRVFCPECGLRLIRPALLMKHMSRVHSKQNFSCVVETGGLPSFTMDVDSSGITWTCCEEKFEERSAFIEHRRTVHLPLLEAQTIIDDRPTTSNLMDQEQRGVDAATSVEGEMVAGPDGSYQVLVPEGLDYVNADIFVMWDDTFDGKGAKVQLVAAPRGDGVEHIVTQDEITQGGGEVIQLTEEQYQRLQMGNLEWDGSMGYVYVNEEDYEGKSMIEEHVEELDEEMIEALKDEHVGPEPEEEEVEHQHHHDDLHYENVIEEGVVDLDDRLDQIDRIDGELLFD